MAQLHTDIIDQLGGTGLRTALTYIGAKKMWERTYSLEIEVNGKEDCRTIVAIVVTPGDEYDVYIEEYEKDADHLSGYGNDPMYRRVQREVYAENLKDVVEWEYDEYIKARNNGFINL